MVDDDDIPTLDDILRPGSEATRGANGKREPEADPATLSDDQIEAIAARVVEHYTKAMEKAVERAIRKALEQKRTEQEG